MNIPLLQRLRLKKNQAKPASQARPNIPNVLKPVAPTGVNPLIKRLQEQAQKKTVSPGIVRALPMKPKPTAQPQAKPAIVVKPAIAPSRLVQAVANKTLAPRPVSKPLIIKADWKQRAGIVKPYAPPAPRPVPTSAPTTAIRPIKGANPLWCQGNTCDPKAFRPSAQATAAQLMPQVVRTATLAPQEEMSEEFGESQDPAQNLVEAQEQGIAPLQLNPPAAKTASTGTIGLILLGLVAGGYFLSKGGKSAPSASLSGTPAKSKSLKINL